MKKIGIAYWYGRDLIPKYKHNQEFNYTTRRKNQIIKDILDAGLHVMAYKSLDKTALIIWIDNGRFRQR